MCLLSSCTELCMLFQIKSRFKQLNCCVSLKELPQNTQVTISEETPEEETLLFYCFQRWELNFALFFCNNLYFLVLDQDGTIATCFGSNRIEQLNVKTKRF